MTSSVRTGSTRSNGSMVSRSLRKVCVLPSERATGPTRPRMASKACGQSSSAPSSRPIRWSGIVAPFGDFQPDALVVLALALGPGHADGAHLGGGQDVRATIGLLVEPHDVDDPQGVDGLRDEVGAGTDQRGVGVSEGARHEVDEDLV